MSRWIDAEYAMAYPIRIDHYDKEHGNKHFVLGIESVMEYLDYAPSIDIVRCKECKFIRTYEDETSFYYCALEDRPNRQWSVDETDYCSWAEREGE